MKVIKILLGILILFLMIPVIFYVGLISLIFRKEEIMEEEQLELFEDLGLPEIINKQKDEHYSNLLGRNFLTDDEEFDPSQWVD